ncbi:MAG: TrpB-like pyridoxal phosphate-dependent enzyme, partial [Candidatus Micrarchaeota archaeon]|nr:TrpB-like pyridoxal phosphate-dependent enzyme [Candidatus Micrarchaeota archaeon]
MAIKHTKILLREEDVPREYYNILPDLPTPLAPPLHPGTKKPASPADFEAIFPKEIIRQEMSQERFIPIPEEVRDALLRSGRPSPLFRAERLEKHLKTPARIYFKHEGLNPCGSHKPNTAIAQTYYNMKEGVERLITETGAGQWGTALAYSTMLFGMKCEVYMVKVSFDQKPYRKIMIETYGAKIHASPSVHTQYGKSVLAKQPDHSGSLGVAISEAIESVVTDPTHKSKYALGSVLNHVMLHQTVIGQEVRQQLAMEDTKPDYVIGCIGGGSNFAGISFPLIYDRLKGKNNAEFIAVEPASCPTTTKGKYEYDFGDTAGMTPLIKMYTLGRDFVPSKIHAGGLRYHGMAPTVSSLVAEGIVKPRSYEQKEVFAAAMTFAQTEGIIAAPESSHAIKAAIDVALD